MSEDDTEQQAPDVVVAEFREIAQEASRYGWGENEIAAALREVAWELDTETGRREER